jgi:hypothetical protein
MNDYDNRQLIGRGQRLPYVNDHKEPVKTRRTSTPTGDMLKQPVRQTFTKEHLKNNSRISVENAFKETTLIKSDLAYEQRLRQCLGFAAVGSSPLVPYNQFAACNESTGRHANGLGCS